MPLSVQFLGAARQVTGSKHLLRVGDDRILLECGLVQGPRRLANEKNRRLPVAGRDVDAVILSHAHIDHCGALPRLVKDGFRGPIWCTEATADLLALMLRDAAHIQSQDAQYLRKRGHEVEPLYDQEDVERTLRQVRGVPYRRPEAVTRDVQVEFLDAGHILGAAIVVIDARVDHRARRLVFTGDYGRRDLPILRNPEPLPECDVLITESTYGDRLHPPRVDMMAELARIVAEELHDGGRVIVPAFAVGRTQSVVMFLGQLMREGALPALPIHVDSPMSRQATEIMSRHPDLFDDQTRTLIATGHSPFFFDGVHYVASVEESKALNQLRTGVIVAASGMCEAGRVLHHLAQSVGRREDCVLMVGYQAQGTLGRKLIDGEPRVNILGQAYDVRCRVRSMQGLSAHADWRELLAATRPLAGRCGQVFVVHGEEPAAEAYAGRLRDAGFRDVVVPASRETHEIR
ncbi:MAG: MBL fold metallo-hydrolase [Planctomycetes bacterium]|nr:MBL fold metallo-hydrolase [Planctomycetota bacterium]